MADDLKPTDYAFLILLKVVDREISNPELDRLYGVRLTGEPYARLNGAGYVDSTKKGSTYWHKLPRKGEKALDQPWEIAGNGTEAKEQTRANKEKLFWAALAALRLTWAPVPDDVWQPLPLHVDGLHTDVVQELLAGITDAKTSPGPSPLGIALLGRRGSGKTHLLGWLRQRVQEQGGYFFLVSLLDEQSFWPSVLAYLLDGLARPVPGSGSQLRL